MEATNTSPPVPRRGYRFTAGVRTVEIPCRIESIAVLPLANLSGDPAQEYFADGITEALITELAKIRSLRVVSRTSVMRYQGHEGDRNAQIARALRVQAMLEGSVMKSGDRLRITAQLIHAAADQHLWAETYEGSISDDSREYKTEVAREVADRCACGDSARTREPGSAVSRTATTRSILAIPQGPILRTDPDRGRAA